MFISSPKRGLSNLNIRYVVVGKCEGDPVRKLCILYVSISLFFQLSAVCGQRLSSWERPKWMASLNDQGPFSASEDDSVSRTLIMRQRLGSAEPTSLEFCNYDRAGGTVDCTLFWIVDPVLKDRCWSTYYTAEGEEGGGDISCGSRLRYRLRLTEKLRRNCTDGIVAHSWDVTLELCDGSEEHYRGFPTPITRNSEITSLYGFRSYREK